jgi:hypothetical protein
MSPNRDVRAILNAIVVRSNGLRRDGNVVTRICAGGLRGGSVEKTFFRS